MRHLRRIALAGLLGLAVAPATATASTQWLYTPSAGAERLPIADGVTVEVPLSSGKSSTLVLKAPGKTGVKIPCGVSGTGAFWNTPEGGRDETRSIRFTCAGVEACAEPTVTPYLPWTSTLLESATLPLVDRWEGMALEVSCAGVDYGVFTGSVAARVGDVDPAGSGPGDELDNLFSWHGTAKNGVLAPNGDEVWLVGGLRMGGKGWGITDEAGGA
jgi:hypothetical protein